jgi:hypothetical protein
VSNGQFQSSLDFNYILIPLKTGSFTIPEIPVRSGKEIRHTHTLTIHVSSSAAKAKTPEQEEGIFTTAEVDDQEPFVNQQIIYTFRLYNRLRIQGASMEPLEFDGFHAEKLGKEREYAQVIKGKQYNITEVRFALFPQRSGILTIPPAKLQCQVVYRSKRGGSPLDRFFEDPFFGGFGRSEIRTAFLSTKPIQIHVKPLPLPDKPDLETPLVGAFNLTAQLSQQEMKVGDSATITITVTGQGNVYDIPDPKFPDFPEFKIYEDKPVLDLKTTLDGISGVKTFKKALVPTKPGDYRFPPIRVPYLDPNTGIYRMAETKPIPIRVLAGSEEEKLHLVEGEWRHIEKEEIKLLGKDILPIKISITALRGQSVKWANPVILFLIFFPPLTFSVFFLWERQKRHMAVDQACYRRKKALKGWKKNKKAILSLIDQNPSEFYSQTSRSLKQFLGDRLSVAGQALTPLELDKKLEEFKIPAELRMRLQHHMQILEKGAFGALHQISEDRETILKDLEKIINQLLRCT